MRADESGGTMVCEMETDGGDCSGNQKKNPAVSWLRFHQWRRDGELIE
jgi:hypothetical protein